jgi:hypothetical protein
VTSDDLDKQLDSYMMKDEKYAQSKLDADLDAYMANNEDEVMADVTADDAAGNIASTS